MKNTLDEFVQAYLEVYDRMEELTYEERETLENRLPTLEYALNHEGVDLSDIGDINALLNSVTLMSNIIYSQISEERGKGKLGVGVHTTEDIFDRESLRLQDYTDIGYYFTVLVADICYLLFRKIRHHREITN